MAPQLLAALGSIALVIGTLALIALHIFPTGFNPVRDPVSFYIVSRYGVLYRVQVVASGICALSLLIALELLHAPLPALGTIMLAAYSVARILIAAFPADVRTAATRAGEVHIALAIITFSAIAIAAGNLTSHIQSFPSWHGSGTLLNAAAILTDIAAVLFLLVSIVPVPVLRRFVGITERGIYVGAFLWLGLAIAPLLGAHR